MDRIDAGLDLKFEMERAWDQSMKETRDNMRQMLARVIDEMKKRKGKEQ